MASFGVYDDPALQEYVAQLGHSIAERSERPKLPWTFRLVDDPAVNAFALPGGFVYMTRGILAYLDSEAELAMVMGHEVGHVTARHSASQMSNQQLMSLGLGVGMIAVPELRRYGDLAQLGLGIGGILVPELAERWADARNLCAAHTATLLGDKNSGASISERILNCLAAVEPKLAAHERSQG